MASTSQISEQLVPGLRDIIGVRLGGRVSFYSQLLRVEASERSFEEILHGAGLPIATELPESEPYDTYDPIEGAKKRVTHNAFGIGAEVTQEAMEDNLYSGQGSTLDSLGNGLADSLAEVVEIQGHRFFNTEAFATSTVPSFLQPLPDLSASISVYNTAHGAITGGEAGTQSNRPATDVDLTMTSFRTALSAMKRYRNDRNLRVPEATFPSRMVVPPEIEWDAKEILGSKNDPTTSNLVENVTKGIVSLIVDPYLDDIDSWFLLPPEHWLLFLWRVRPAMDSYDDKSRRVAVFVGRERFGMGAIHWLGPYASPGG